jgi:hypothetical protein
MTNITTGAPKTAVTELILSSVGAKTVLAIKSQKRQNTEPPIKHAGIIIIGFAVPNNAFISCGTAIPTNEIGPAKAVTQAESTLDSNIKSALNNLTFTPIFLA